MTAQRGRRPVRVTRTRQIKGESLVGREVEVDVGPIAHGGHCVARVAGQVVFVRHALPGERVRLRYTEGGSEDSFVRADAVEVIEASADRVPAPCQYAGACGGCDFQHISLAAQRELKRQVVAEQFRRLAKVEWDGVVEEVPGAPDGLGWRTRTQWVSGPSGVGFRRYRSQDVVPIQECLLEAPGVRRTVDGVAPAGSITAEVAGIRFDVPGDGFWQVHPAAPQTLLHAVLEAAQAQPGETVLDLYAGVGLFSAGFAQAVGASGSVIAVEGHGGAAHAAQRNLAAFPHADVVHDDVLRFLGDGAPAADLVVLDPPRVGAKAKVLGGVAATGASRVVYVACDPAALARDTASLMGLGYSLDSVRAFDLFPMTHHVECVALLTRSGSDLN